MALTNAEIQENVELDSNQYCQELFTKIACTHKFDKENLSRIAISHTKPIRIPYFFSLNESS